MGICNTDVPTQLFQQNTTHNPPAIIGAYPLLFHRCIPIRRIYIILKPAGDYFEQAGTAHVAVQQQFSIFIFCHIPLTILSLVVVRQLMVRNKMNILFVVTNSFAGGMYIAGAVILLMR